MEVIHVLTIPINMLFLTVASLQFSLNIGFRLSSVWLCWDFNSHLGKHLVDSSISTE